MGLLFYPRGGSAQVARYLSHALIAKAWPVTLVSGSLGASGALGNAEEFFAGIDTVAASYDDAVTRFERGDDPMDAPFPMQPSYERREGVPDRSFTLVSPAQGEQIVAAWSLLIAGAPELQRARVLHLHHLTPIHEAGRTVLPHVPIVTHLHGTELRCCTRSPTPSSSSGPMPTGGRRGWASGRAERMRRS